MKLSSNDETIRETFGKTWDVCTPMEGSQPLTRECMPEKTSTEVKSSQEKNYGSGYLCECESSSCYECGI
jgi:hypothetical protein